MKTSRKYNIKIFLRYFKLLLIALVLSDYFYLNKYIFNDNNIDIIEKRVFGKRKVETCVPLNNEYLSILGSKSVFWSITTLDKYGSQIAGVNSHKPMIPASNQKLLTTAFALDKLNNDFTLKTSVYKSNNGVFHIVGNGDPDIDRYFIKKITNKIIEQSSINDNNLDNLKIHLYEVSSYKWWPSSWTSYDRYNIYGPPITTLAFTSNAQSSAIQNPPQFIRNIFLEEFDSKGITPNILVKNYSRFVNSTKKGELIYNIKSAPFLSLLSLANSESHNYTAEVLLRQASNNWYVENASKRMLGWLRYKRIPVKNFDLYDGSGLSRKNRVTTFGLAHLLKFVSNQDYFSRFKSSLAIVGIRGTLRSVNFDQSLYGKFYGKTGTLSGIRSITGILNTDKGNIFISIIGNNVNEPDYIINKLLLASTFIKRCG